ncbi:hypothetical protein MAPG_06874 [Magnaporthiopsis poae ATCC 64411]|uniref:CENP-V/GFA domain-containing protein n=1 Tax=Magnaporthiopsis poae (strain ATCC 64411 / 73-15) TaxID=644358 RepID=A0A0C4E382_MAGP6|nr:hypothetical protein MAPG_06874 [Magnaporthiopsis poae ATCC 64411]
MASLRPLRGGCHCGRNHYTVNLPENCAEIARVLFDTDPRHRIFQASPISAFLRVPLTWYSSTTSAFFPDEASPTIRRTYTHPSQQHTKRCFCGFCGTPLSYWSEDPPAEAEFIRLTLGSLHSEDLGDLEDLGLIPGTPPSEAETEGDGGASGSSNSRPTRSVVARETLGVPWFDSMVAGSRLGNLRASRVGGRSRDGRVTYEWEIVEWTADGDGDDKMDDDGDGSQPGPSKRLKHGGDGAGDAGSAEPAQPQ